MASTKKESYINGYHKSVLKGHNMRTAANSCQFLLPTLERMLEVNSSLNFLDVGCGSGSISATLAQLMPKAAFTALDISPSALEPAKKAAEDLGVTNMTFVPGNVYTLPFPDASMDIVHAQQLLAHLQRPVDAIKEMLRVCKPGGIVALREYDLPCMSWYPPNKGLERWHALLLEHIRVFGSGVLTTGRQLKAYCRQAGVETGSLVCSASTFSYGSEEEVQSWGESWIGRVLKSQFAKEAVDGGLATKEDLEELAQAWREWMESEDAFFASLQGEMLVKV